MSLIMPQWLSLLAIPGLMAIPYYFFNKYLLSRINPRQSEKKFLLYFIITIVSVFIYMAIGVFLIIRVAVWTK